MNMSALGFDGYNEDQFPYNVNLKQWVELQQQNLSPDGPVLDGSDRMLLDLRIEWKSQ